MGRSFLILLFVLSLGESALAQPRKLHGSGDGFQPGGRVNFGLPGEESAIVSALKKQLAKKGMTFDSRTLTVLVKHIDPGVMRRFTLNPGHRQSLSLFVQVKDLGSLGQYQTKFEKIIKDVTAVDGKNNVYRIELDVQESKTLFEAIKGLTDGTHLGHSVSALPVTLIGVTPAYRTLDEVNMAVRMLPDGAERYTTIFTYPLKTGLGRFNESSSPVRNGIRIPITNK